MARAVSVAKGTLLDMIEIRLSGSLRAGLTCRESML